MNCKDSITPILEKAGCIRMGEAMSYAGGGDTFSMLATVDRLIEMGYLREINFGECHGQDRIFVKGSK